MHCSFKRAKICNINAVDATDIMKSTKYGETVSEDHNWAYVDFGDTDCTLSPIITDKNTELN